MLRQSPPASFSTQRLWQSLCGLLLLAIILNGSVFWLQRVGFVAPEKYHAYLTQFDHPPGYQRSTAENDALHTFIADLYQTPGWLAVVKIVKDIWLLVFVVVGLWIGYTRRVLILSVPQVLMAGLGLCLLVGLWRGYTAGGWLLPALGLRGFSWLLLMLLGAWAATTDKLATLGRCLLAALLLQLL